MLMDCARWIDLVPGDLYVTSKSAWMVISITVFHKSNDLSSIQWIALWGPALDFESRIFSDLYPDTKFGYGITVVRDGNVIITNGRWEDKT